MDSSILRSGIERIGDQLCKTIGGNFEFNVSLGLQDESLEKLCMLVNFMLDTSRRTLAELSTRNEQLAELDRLRSDFFANISHELRTPLTLILAPAQTLLSKRENASLTPAQRQALTTIHNNALRLLQLVNSLLDFSKLEAGHIEPKPEALNLEAVTRSLFDDFLPLMRERGLTGTCRCVLAHPFVMLDRYLYERMIFNLLSNAIKFTPPGGSIELSLEGRPKRLLLSVSDTGIGIAEKDFGSLFQKFRQIEASSTRRFEGTGLGLAMVKEFAELQGGKVTVASQPGAGTTFKLELPCVLADHAPVAQGLDPSLAGHRPTVQPMLNPLFTGPTSPAPATSHHSEQAPGPERRVLIAEDNAELGAYIQAELSQLYQVRRAEDGEAALQMAKDWRPHLILSDVMMPKLDGFGLCRALKSDPITSDTPVVLLTALTHRDALIKGWKAGADEYLFKPFNPQELLARVESLFKLVAARQRAEEERIKAAQEAAARAEAEARIESLHRVNRAKDEFLAAVSHELRTPLNVIAGWTDLLVEQSIGPDEYERVFAVLQRNVRAQMTLVDDLLDISRIITGKLTINVKAVRLHDIVNEVVNSMSLAAQAKRLDVRLQMAAYVEPVAGDKDRLQQVVWNLLSNAIKFTPDDGKIVISLGVDGGRACIAVRDTGIGIEQEFLPHVFERFLQEDGSSTRRFSGLGLGLSIARHIVELHGGSIEAASAGRNKGAIFTIKLPLMPQTKAPTRPITKPTKSLRADVLKGVRVLLVEDNPETRDVIARMLRASGAVVTEAASAKEALAHYERETPSIVVSDISMPDEDGCALIRTIRQREDASGERTPALALTASASDTDFARTLESGFQEHLIKPVRAEHLIQAIEKWLRR